MTDSDSESAEPVAKKESFWKRNILPRLSSTSRTSLRQLLPQAEVNEIGSETSDSGINEEIIHREDRHKNKIRRPRSAGDITETLHCTTIAGVGAISTFPGGAVPGQEERRVSLVSSPHVRTSQSNNSISNSNRHGVSESISGTQTNNNNNENNPSSSTGGILSFFGVKKFKSTTRHLERSNCQNQGADNVVATKAGSTVHGTNNNKVADLRYTKFPLAYGKNSGLNTGKLATAGAQSNNKLSDASSSTSPSSSSLSSISRHKSKLCRSLDSPQVDGVDASASTYPESSIIPPNAPFEESQIQFTPQTKTYVHPHRSPIPPNRASHASSSGNFITNTVSSIGRKVVNSVTPGSKNKNKSKLKVKSKSDNSLHRVHSNVNVNSVLASFSASNSGSSGVPRNASASTFTSYLDNQHGIESSGELRLNSVQVGDHATIRLPWTGGINNLSTPSSSRPFIPNTHNNNFDLSSSSGTGSERYVECGSSFLRSAPNPLFSSSRNSTDLHVGPRVFNESGTTRIIVNRRRSRSLERCSATRVLPISNCGFPNTSFVGDGFFSSNPITLAQHFESRSGGISRSQSRKESGSERERQKTRSAHSLERKTPHSVRQLLTPTEQEILLRNIDWKSTSTSGQLSPVGPPPRRPEKPSKPGFFPASNSGGSRPCKKEQRRPFEKLHRSAPNSSFSNSSESGESSYSAPPSPPPRPPSTLKPESSRLLVHPQNPPLSTTTTPRHQISSPSSRSPGSFPTTSLAGGGIIMNPVPKRRPVAPRSHGSSSDSGVSHISSISTVRGTSDFSDESGGSVNISQHSQHSASVLSHSTTSSSGVSHHSSSANNVVSAPAGISLEDVRNSGFINKPSKGWLHSDQMLSKEGVTYTVRYIGCLDVNTSMKSLDFDTRSLIAKECINQVCEAAGLRSQDKKRKIDRRVARILGIRPRLDHAGSDVHLTITSTCLKLTSLDTGSVIAVHDMPNISFASGGDATMLDFVAYVAKDAIVGRACFVLECGSGLAQDVITTVGQAFELRFKEYLQKRPPPPRIPLDDPEYYNDLPGKVPPDIQAAAVNSLSKDKIQNVSKSKSATTRAKEPPPLNLHSNFDKELSVNLIDFEAPTPPAFGPSVEDKQLDSFLLPGSDHAIGANCLGASGSSVVGTGLGLPNSPSQPQAKDPFDMQPFAASLPQSIPAEVIEAQRRLLEVEIWFHGTVSRSESEELLKHDGDFLVRESMACPGQFVLTGLQGGSPKHLLLVDPQGVVRTKDRTFDNVIHLIKYHSDNSLPIISAESMVLLRNPVTRVISS